MRSDFGCTTSDKASIVLHSDNFYGFWTEELTYALHLLRQQSGRCRSRLCGCPYYAQIACSASVMAPDLEPYAASICQGGHKLEGLTETVSARDCETELSGHTMSHTMSPYHTITVQQAQCQLTTSLMNGKSFRTLHSTSNRWSSSSNQSAAFWLQTTVTGGLSFTNHKAHSSPAQTNANHPRRSTSTQR